MSGISKRFPGVQALDNVDFEVAPGEIHALLGENGAGKSTLLKILSGAEQAGCGTIAFAGESVALASPHDAQRLGIVTIYQEFTLAPNMTIAENVFIGREPGSRLFVSWRRMAAETRAITKRIGLDVNPMALVRDLSVAEQQMVEIARALSMQSRLIVMDEPTSALSASEVEKLFAIVRDLKAQGFEHHLRHPPPRGGDARSATATRCCATGGRSAAGAVAETTIDGIIRLMVGREVNALFAHREAAQRRARSRCKVEGLTRRGNAPRPACHRARRRLVLACGAARSSGSPAWSAPAAPRWRAPSSAPTRSIPAAFSSTASRSTSARRGRHPPRHRAGARGPQAAGAVPVARRPHERQHGVARPHSAAGAAFVDERAERSWSRNTAAR